MSRGSPSILNQQMLVLASAGFTVPVVRGHPLSLVQVVVVVVVVVIMTVAKVYCNLLCARCYSKHFAHII